jgi:hypothetical protein
MCGGLYIFIEHRINFRKWSGLKAPSPFGEGGFPTVQRNLLPKSSSHIYLLLEAAGSSEILVKT